MELAADPTVERYWRLVCIINGWPGPPDLTTAGDWLTTALRTNTAPGARAGAIAAMATPSPPTRRRPSRMVEQVVIEMLAHGWDLARATGQSTDLAPDIATATLPAVQQIYGDLPRTAGGSFAPARPVRADANPADRLAAYLGRALD